MRGGGVGSGGGMAVCCQELRSRVAGGAQRPNAPLPPPQGQKKKKKDKDGEGEGDEGGSGGDDKGAASASRDDGDDDGDAASGDDSGDEGVVWMTDTSAEAVAARAAEQLSGATAAMVTQGNIEAELEKERKRAEKEAKKQARRARRGRGQRSVHLRSWPCAPHSPTPLRAPTRCPPPTPARHPQAEEATAARRAAAAAALASGDKVEPAVAADALRGALAEGGPEGAAAALAALSVEGGLAGKARALVEAMFVDEPGLEEGGPAAGLKLPSGIKRGAGLLRGLAGDAPGQLALLVGLEWLCAAHPARLREAALGLKALYDEDLAEEDMLLAWAGRADAAKALGVGPDDAAAVRKAVAPVIEWLREGEEGSSEGEGGNGDDDDEDDDEGSDE